MKMKKLLTAIALTTLVGFLSGCTDVSTTDRKAAVEMVFTNAEVVCVPGDLCAFVARERDGTVYFIRNELSYANNISQKLSTNLISSTKLFSSDR